MAICNLSLFLLHMCLLSATISYHHLASPQRVRYSHALYDINNLRSGIYRPITSPSFGFDDILSPEDIILAEERFQNLVKFFNTISEAEIRDVVNRSPSYVTIESSEILHAIKMLQVNVPYVDPVYVFKQRAAGLDLFLSVMQSDFNHGVRVQELQRILPNINVTEFVRRAPHTLTPRYASALVDTIHIFNVSLNLTNMDTIKIVEKFPGVLSIDVKQGIIRLKNTISRLHSTVAVDSNSKSSLEYYTSPSVLANIIKTVPRVLVQDLSKRVSALQNQYPNWDLLAVITVNPRTLTEKLPVLSSRYKSLQSKFAPLIDTDTMISKYPVALLRSPTTLHRAIIAVLSHLPSCNVVDVITNSKILDCDIKRQVDKCRKTFVHSEELPLKRVNPSRRRRDHVVDDSASDDYYDIPSIQRLIENEQIDNLEMQRINSLASDPESIWDVDSTFTAVDLPVTNCPRQLNITDANIGDYTFMKLDPNVSLHLPAELSFLIDPILHNSTVDAVDVMNHSTVVVADSTPRARDSNVNVSHAAELDMTRIIFGNIDLFVDKFPYFLTKLKAWNEEYGPEIAYTVLNAVPKSISKKPSTLRTKIKALYMLVGDALSLDLDDSGDFSPVNLVSSIDMSVSRGHICDRLYQLLRSSPGALRLKPEQLEDRLHDLSGIIMCDVTTAKRCVMDATYLLTEPLDRIALRKRLMSNIFANSNTLKSKFVQENKLYIAYPRLLVQPVAILIRLYYLRKIGILEEFVSQLDELLYCKTHLFISMTSIFLGRDTSEDYNQYLVSVHNRLSDTALSENLVMKEVVMKEVDQSERYLCGVLNDLVKDVARIENSLQF